MSIASCRSQNVRLIRISVTISKSDGDTRPSVERQLPHITPPPSSQVFSWQELLDACNDKATSNLIGKGGYALKGARPVTLFYLYMKLNFLILYRREVMP